MVCPGPRSLRHADRAGDIDAGRAAHAQAFMFQQIEDDGQGFLVGNLIGVVDRRAFEIGGDAALADAFGDRGALRFQFAGLDPGIDRGAQRIGGGDADLRIALLERDGDAGQRAAGADRAGEAVDLAVRLLPDFGTRCLRYGRGGWRYCRTGWPRSRRCGSVFASCSARRPEIFT